MNKIVSQTPIDMCQVCGMKLTREHSSCYGAPVNLIYISTECIDISTYSCNNTPMYSKGISPKEPYN